MSVTLIAETGERFSRFAPYVAAINNAGVVCFAAQTADGSGVFAGDGGEPSELVSPTSGLEVCSHPDINDAGAFCFFACAEGGAPALHARGRDDIVVELAGDVGPLGPTMNEAGAIAFRGVDSSGCAGAFVARGGAIETVALADDDIESLEGLPVIDGAGRVVVRVNRAGGASAITVGAEVLAETGDRFSALGRFPTVTEGGAVAFVGTGAAGRSGAFMVRPGEGSITTIPVGEPGELRGVLVSDRGDIVVYATPVGGAMSIVRIERGEARPIIGVGDERAGSTVTGFVLNPVSMASRSGSIAVRLELADGREQIVRL